MEVDDQDARSHDAQLLRAARRDPDAFLAFYRSHAEWIYRWLMAQLGDPQLASDLTAEVFAQALVSLPRFRGEERGSGTAWLFGIARNLVRRTYEQRRREIGARRELGMALEVLTPDPTTEIDGRLDAEALRADLEAALGGLPTTLREALELRVVQGLSYDEIAEATGVSRPNARMRVSRALREMAGRMPTEEETA